MKNIPPLPSIALVGLLFVASSCQRSDAASAPSATPAVVAGAAAPAALTPSQSELLQIAFEAASAFPLVPHGKNRSRAQEVVTVACFELGQPDLALAYGSQIKDWRRGCTYADYAWCMAQRGDAARAREYVALAQGVVTEQKADPNAQDWRSDLIALKVARALTALGDSEGAAKAAAGIDPGSSNAVDENWAATASEAVRSVTAATVKMELDAIDAGFAAASIGQQHIALLTLARLHEKFFTDGTTREFCEQRIAVGWTRVMPALRLEALSTLVRTCVAAGDRDGGKRLLAAMRKVVEEHNWRPEDKGPWVGRLIELSHRCGETDRARADAEAALVAWHQQRELIVNIWRAESLRPIALAFHALGEREKGDELMALVLEESLENPNSRPRCDDLVDTCVAMCKGAIEPSPGLLARIREIRQGLKEPW